MSAPHLPFFLGLGAASSFLGSSFFASWGLGCAAGGEKLDFFAPVPTAS